MIALGKIILPLFLIIGAVYLVVVEFVSYPRLKKYGHPENNLKLRMGRRLVGALLVIIVAVLMFWGLNFMPRPSIGLFHRQAAHWALVMVLVFVVVILAMWDAVDGLKYLEKLADQVSRKELEDLEEIDRSLQVKQDKNSPLKTTGHHR